MRKILFWFGVVVVALLVMVRPAAADIEQVLPQSGGRDWVNRSQPSVHYVTPGLACNQMRIIGGFDGTWAQTLQLGSETFYYCKFSKVGSSTMTYYVDRSSTVAVCPAAEPPYAYNALTGYCEREVVPPPVDPCAGVVITETFEVTAACMSSDPVSPTCAPMTLQHACGTLVKSDQYDCLTNATQTMCSAVYGSSLEPVQGAPSSPPSQACPSGKSLVTGSSGKAKCYADSSGAIASAVAASQTKKGAKLTETMTQAAAAASAVGGGGAAGVAVGVVAAGGFTGGGSSGGSTASDLMTKNADIANVCADDPRNPICQDNKGVTGVGAGAVSGLYESGALNEGKTFGGSVSSFKSRVLSSGVGGAAGSFFTVNQAAGTCPVWSVDAPMIGVLSFDFYCTSTFQNLLPWIRSVILLIFSVVAFRIAIL